MGLLSASVMAASMFFLSLLFHFSKEDWISQDYNDYNHFSDYGWIVHSAIIIYLVAYHIGIGPLGWMIVVEFIPCRAPVCNMSSASAVSSCWWAFNLAFTMKLVHL